MTTDDDTMKCRACGVSFQDHLGLIGTCRELQSARAEIAALKAKVKELEESDEMWNESGTSADCLIRHGIDADFHRQTILL